MQDIDIETEFLFNSNYLAERLDIFIVKMMSEFSRSLAQKIIANGCVTVNDKVAIKSSLVLKSNDVVKIKIPLPQSKPEIVEFKSDLQIELIFEHEHFLIINKPAGLLVHEVPNKKEVSLVDWVRSKYNITSIGQSHRPGIIHRIDKDTSGLMIIARTDHAHNIFGKLFRERSIKKSYLAIVHGHTPSNGSIDFNIMRDRIHAHKMTHTLSSGGKVALTNYQALKYFVKDEQKYTLIKIDLITGRTHQIRVHFAAIGHFLLGDALYGKQSKGFGRHALHAHTLEFSFDGQDYNFTLEPPLDIKSYLETLTPFYPSIR